MREGKSHTLIQASPYVRSNLTLFFLQGAGAALFVASLLGFYLLIVQLFEVMGFPFHLPVGDLGMLWTRFQVK